MATGGKPSEYQVLLGLEKELVERIIRSGTDVEVLITRAVSKGLIPLQGLEANATSTARSGRERAEQFVARVLEAIRGDPSGERTTLFLQTLDDLSLSPLSEFIRSRLTETTRDTRHETPPPAHRPGPLHQPPGGAYGGGQPKLAPADDEDSGIIREGGTNHNNGNANSGVGVVINAQLQHTMAPADTGGAGITPLSNGVIVVQTEHSDNLEVSSEDDPPAIPETQPHIPHIQLSSSNPMATGVTSVVLEQTQTEQELRARMAEMARHEESLKNKLSQLQVEKEESEQLLEQKEKELTKVKHEKDEEIQSLKAQIKEKEEKIEELQHKLSHQEQQNEALKEEHKAEIAKLKEQLEKTEEKYLKKILQLKDEKHVLELELQKMRTREVQMRLQIAEEKQRTAELKVEVAKQAAELKVEVAEQKQKNTELKAQQEQKQQQEKIEVLERERKDSLTRTKQLEDKIATLERKCDTKPNTS